jgi:hypothetical protein
MGQRNGGPAGSEGRAGGRSIVKSSSSVNFRAGDESRLRSFHYIYSLQCESRIAFF